MKRFALALLLLASGSVWANYANLAMPFSINLVRNEGFMIHGAFGNPAGCTNSDLIFVRADHPNYRLIFDLVMAAKREGQRLLVYITTCQSVPWYASPGSTFNVLEPSGSIGLGF